MSNESSNSDNVDVDQHVPLNQAKLSHHIKKVDFDHNTLEKSTRTDHKFRYDFKQPSEQKLSVYTREDSYNNVGNMLCIKTPTNKSTLSAKKMNITDVATPRGQTQLVADAHMNNSLGMIQGSINSNNIGNYDSDNFYSNRRLNSRTDELEFKRNTFWKSCCDSVIDRRATVFFTQVAIGAIVIFFAMAKMLLSSPYRCSGDDPSVYVGLISVILGWFVPAPSMK
jgi:hypothetical protein